MTTTTKRSEPITRNDVLQAMEKITGGGMPSADDIRNVLGRGSKTTILKYRADILSGNHNGQADSIAMLEEFSQELSDFMNRYDSVIGRLKDEVGGNAALIVEITQRELALEKRRDQVDDQIRHASKKIRRLKKRNSDLENSLHQRERTIESLRGQLMATRDNRQRLQYERDTLLDLVPIDERPESLRDSGQEEIEFEL